MRILAFHVICTTYGFWLPNDERGSCSDFVRARHLLPYGEANPISDRRSHAALPLNFEVRRMARESLMYPNVEFTGEQALAVASGFRYELETYGGEMHALAVLPDHIHAVVSPPRYDVRRFAGRLKGAATRELARQGLHPLASYKTRKGSTPSPWAELPWVVYLFTEEDVRRAIRYVNDNPVRAGLPAQQWSFIKPFAFS